MVGTPDTTHTLVGTHNRLHRPLQLLTAGLFEQVRLCQNLLLLHVAYADCFFAAVDVVAPDHGVLVRARRDADFNLRVGLCKGRQGVFEERAVEGASQWIVKAGL